MAGERFQVYLPEDLAKRLKEIPRYERSAEVQKALREYWEKKDKSKPDKDNA